MVESKTRTIERKIKFGYQVKNIEMMKNYW